MKLNKNDLIEKQKCKMNLYCLKCLMFTRNNKIKVKCDIDGKFNLYSPCNDFSFKKFATINKKELSNLLKDLIQL